MVTSECACQTCALNASKIGKDLPLRVAVTEGYAVMLGSDRKAIHNTVADAHNPSIPNRWFIAR